MIISIWFRKLFSKTKERIGYNTFDKAVEKTWKLTWKKLNKQKIKGRIQNRLLEEMRDKSLGDTLKDIKIRMHMRDLKNSYRKEEEQPPVIRTFSWRRSQQFFGKKCIWFNDWLCQFMQYVKKRMTQKSICSNVEETKLHQKWYLRLKNRRK